MPKINPRFAKWLEKYRRFEIEDVQKLTVLYKEDAPKARRRRREPETKQRQFRT